MPRLSPSLPSLRNTRQREVILHYILSVRTHPTAETVYRDVKRKIPDITLATVYRNLHLLADQGKINRLGIHNEYRFDGFTHPHQHLVCTRCHSVQDLENQALSTAIERKLNTPTFNVDSIQVQAFGTCTRCR